MKKYTSKEIREIWLNFFKSKGHLILPSKSLVPINDNSLLWINSGVATLKDYFAGKKIPPSKRLTNSQKAIRTNDIENVGFTSRHHTFFEMLGNFSIGDYFKKEALEFAYELLFSVFEFPKEKIYITYFDEDKEAYEQWIALGIDLTHLIKGNRSTNFWDVGSGPCGPSTEIFFDRGERYDDKNVGLKLLEEDIENDRYIEIWNIVFSQFNNDGNNNYEELAQKNIDTGAGLERIASIMQDVPTNFDTDLFLPIIKKIETLTNYEYKTDNYFDENKNQTIINRRFKIIADHIRAASLAINDGVKPSNIQRGYIIRRLIRRAYREGIFLKIQENEFLYLLVETISQVLDVYSINVKEIEKIIKEEEKLFSLTIKQGEKKLKEAIQENKVDEEFVFKLFETYGFPIEMTHEILREEGIEIDLSKIDKLRNAHLEKSRGESFKAMDSQIQIIQSVTEKISQFIGYNFLESESKVIFQGEEQGKFYLLLDKTPFYATNGGQERDKGRINDIEVIDVFKDKYGNNWHVLNKKIEPEIVKTRIYDDIRLNKERNHSATHLLNKALRIVLGDSVIQLGSNNNENGLRLDFPISSKPSNEQIQKVEDLVNSWIKESIDRKYIETTLEDAKKLNAITLEGESYGDKVRVVVFGDKSIELCGGTHIANTAKIEKFKIIKCESKGSGVYRIEAITSNKQIFDYVQKELLALKEELHNLISKNIKLDPQYKLNLEDKFLNQDEEIKYIKLQILAAREKAKHLLKSQAPTFDIDNVTFSTYKGKKAYINLNIDSKNNVKNIAIAIKNKYPDCLVIVGYQDTDRMILAVASNSLNAKEIFDEIASHNDGNGGGNQSFAMGSCLVIKAL